MRKKALVGKLFFCVALFLCAFVGTTSATNLEIVSDSTWKTIDSAPTGWKEISFDDTDWMLSEAPWPGFLAWYSPIDYGMWDPAEEDWGRYSGSSEAYFRKTFTLNGAPSGEIISAVFQINVDNTYELYINGLFVGSDDNWRDMETYDVKNFLQWGENVIAIHAIDEGSYEGVSLKFEVETRPTTTPTPTPPSPSVSSDTSSLPPMHVGEFQDITFTVSNNGGDSDTESYLSVSVSPSLQIEEWSSSSSDMIFVHSPVGSEIWNPEGNKITSEYELLDAYEAYSAGETNTIIIKVKATASGSQWIKYRTAFDTLDSGYEFIRNPTSGLVDQQGWHVYEIPVDVSQPSPSNLLKNPGFEDGFSNWERSTEEGDVEFYLGASAHSGIKSGVIHIMSSGGWGHYSQEVPISNSKNIHAEVWAKLANGGDDNAELAVQTYDADGILLDGEDKSVDSTEWTKISLDFSPDPNAVSAVVFLDGASSGEEYIIFDDAYLSVSGSTIPSPAVSSDISSLSMSVGETKDITFTVSNNGGDSDTESYLSVSVSPGLHIEEWSSSSSDMNFNYSHIGSKIWNSTGEQVTSKYELLDAYEAYSAGETNTVTIKVKATETGSQWVKYRTAFDTLASGYNFIRNPTTGPLDQQKWHTYEIPAEVTDSYTLKFEGYDLNEENNLKITIVNSETIYLSPDDPAAHDVWRSYEIDISNFMLMDDDHNIVNFFGGHCGWKDIQILRNGEIIRRFHPNYIIKPRMEDVTSVSYEFNPFRAPITYTHAGLTTIEMYAPKEAKKGVPYIIEIVAQVPRAHDIYFTGNGVVQLCYSEEIDINLETNHIAVRSNEGAWDDGICYSPEDCDLGKTYYEELIKLMFGNLEFFKELPGMGFTLAMIEEYEKCNFDDGYCKLDNYNCGPPSSTEWKDINNYDTCNHIYDSEFLSVESIKMDKIISRYSLTFNELGEYTIYGFFDGIEVDIDYLDPGNRKIGKELDWTVKVVE